MIERNTLSDVNSALSRQAAVALIGPRQVGKTTLALEVGKGRDAVYLDLEDRDDRNKLTNPVLFFEANEDRLIILDEIHRMPEIFDSLRGVIDKGRRKGKGKGRFLILGSAAIELLRQSETLAGRIAYIEMPPVLATEVEDDRQKREELWLRGGFPDAYLATSDLESFAIRKDFIRTYLERDVPMFGPRIPATTMERLWTMLAHNQGTLLNASQLARGLDLSAQSITRYVDLLCDLLLVRRLQPYHVNVGKRLVKSPKVFVRDSGLVHSLLGLKDLNQLIGHPVVGQSWEGFVIETLLAASPWRAQANFYRTIAGAEIDLLIQHTDSRIWAIEIKRGLTAKPGKGFYNAIEDLQPEKAFLVHSGDDRYPIAKNIEALGVIELASELQGLA